MICKENKLNKFIRKYNTIKDKERKKNDDKEEHSIIL